MRLLRPPSIALRMAAWYALSAFALIVAATGVLYWVLVTNLQQEDVRVLEDNLHNARLLLRSSSPGLQASHPEHAPAAIAGEPAQVYVRVLDGDGRSVLETPGMSGELPPLTAMELGALRSGRDVGGEIVSRSGRTFRMLAASSANPGEETTGRLVQVAMDQQKEVYLLKRYRERFWLVLSFSVFACTAIGYAIARSGMRPIEDIAGTAERIRSTTLHERLPAAGLPGELAGLATTFNSMLDRLESSFTRISQFSDDVAHELRTPINNLRGEIEVALNRARSHEEYGEVLGSCLEECSRISRVVDSLLFLARSESAVEPLQREGIEVVKELKIVEEFYEPLAGEAGVRLELSVADSLRGRVDRTLFQQAVGNLVSNAIAHTARDGSVRIIAGKDGTSLRVTVSDTGVGIAPEHLPHVFERFYRVERARSGSRQNAGLGLSLVKSIVERHGGGVHIDSEVGCGTEIVLTFPHTG